MEHAKRRAGRPSKEDPADVRSVAIGVVVSAKEHAAIKAAADERELSLSSYLRELGLGERHRSPRQAMTLFELADRVERLGRAALSDEAREGKISSLSLLRGMGRVARDRCTPGPAGGASAAARCPARRCTI